MRRDDNARTKATKTTAPLKGAPVVSPYDVLDARFVMEARDASQLPRDPRPEIAFAGRSNVGKSTLLNALCQRKGLARTSSTPGRTRGLNVFDLDLRGGQKLRFIDLPGYGYAQLGRTERRTWGPMIEGYLRDRDSLASVMMLVDARRGAEEEETQLVSYLTAIGKPFVMVATKIDKLTRNQRLPVLTSLKRDFGHALGLSGETSEGREELMRLLVARCTPDPSPTTDALRRDD